MPENYTLRGWVATDPRTKVTQKGIPITTFRVACPERRFNKETNTWDDLQTSWFTVIAFRRLATNTALSIKKGHRVIVHGKLRVRDWQTEAAHGVSVEIDADSIGHDLGWGTAYFNKSYGKRTDDSQNTTVVTFSDAQDWKAPDDSEMSEEFLEEKEKAYRDNSGHIIESTGEIIPCNIELGVLCEDCDKKRNAEHDAAEMIAEVVAIP